MSKAKKAQRTLGAFCGLDLSLAGTGAVMLSATGQVVSVLAFTTSSKEESKPSAKYRITKAPLVKQGDAKAMWHRTVYVAAFIRNWIAEYAEPGCLFGIEDHAFGARGTSIYQLGHLHGLVRRDLQEADKHWLLIAPTELKAAVTGKGNADKEAMMAVPTPSLDQKAFGTSTRNNVVDAYWLARVMKAYVEYQYRKEWQIIPESFAKVMRPHAKKPGLLNRELLP